MKIAQYKRKIKGLTNYKKRLTLLKSRKPRLVIRRSNKNIVLQLIDYKPDGDIILLSTHSRELKKYGWKPQLNNLPSAYLTGLLCGNKLKKKNSTEFVVDIGFNRKINGSTIFAAVKGINDSGIKLSIEKVAPPEERITGAHISKYATLLKEDQEKYQKQFSNYTKINFNPEDFEKHFLEIKNKILEGKNATK
jgi:large subunit ribosomal protein L18